ncbi:hypothetical protein HAX54_052649 [Datura stramonium]|uniref:Uncharacterized protein n=1 Tax=Datura stramonium TaxID=4076 RepID=A0ABS8RRP8_DATST|nr:hypothetical protein [Datura stramonium]
MCKILRVWEIKEDEWMLLVWDGTDTPPVAITAELEDDMNDPFPLQSVPICLPRDVLCDLPPLGTVLRVTLDFGYEKFGVNVFKANRWVNFDSLRCQLHASLWHASLLPTTRFCYLHDQDDTVLQRMRDHENRFRSRCGAMPLSSLPWRAHVTGLIDLDESSCKSQVRYYETLLAIGLNAGRDGNQLVENHDISRGLYTIGRDIPDLTSLI